MIYAGIGSRETPQDVCREMADVAAYAASQLHILRTGAAAGADQAFMVGCKRASGHGEIFLPWHDYEKASWEDYDGFDVHLRPTREAATVAEHFHPVWSGLSKGAKLLHARNSHIVMGCMCQHPVDLIVCYTPGGTAQGGTGQALRLAKANCIRVVDLGAPEPWGQILSRLYKAFEYGLKLAG